MSVLYSVFSPMFVHPSAPYNGVINMMRGHDEFAGIGCPFDGIQHPLLAPKNANRLKQLEASWGQMVPFRDDLLLPALRDHEIVLCDGLGLDAFIGAAAFASPEMYDQLTAFHHEQVERQLKAFGSPTPRYVIVEMDPDDEIACLQNELSLSDAGITPEAIRKFVARKQQIMDDYFDPLYGQLDPVMIDYTPTLDSLCDKIVDVLTGRAVAYVPDTIAA